MCVLLSTGTPFTLGARNKRDPACISLTLSSCHYCSRGNHEILVPVISQCYQRVMEFPSFLCKFPCFSSVASYNAI